MRASWILTTTAWLRLGTRAVTTWIEILGLDGPDAPRWRVLGRGALRFAGLSLPLLVDGIDRLRPIFAKSVRSR